MTMDIIADTLSDAGELLAESVHRVRRSTADMLKKAKYGMGTASGPVDRGVYLESNTDKRDDTTK